jgi:hypothetical protein
VTNANEEASLIIWEHFESELVITEPGLSDLTVNKKEEESIRQNKPPDSMSYGGYSISIYS